LLFIFTFNGWGEATIFYGKALPRNRLESVFYFHVCENGLRPWLGVSRYGADRSVKWVAIEWLGLSSKLIVYFLGLGSELWLCFRDVGG
jgi:hypothetical protein